jgi:hypothetical protein
MGNQHETYKLAVLLRILLMDLHPTYANTSRRGRGIGGQMLSQQCNVVDPELAEYGLIQAIEDAIRNHYHKAETEGVSMGSIHDGIMSEAAELWKEMASDRP